MRPVPTTPALAASAAAAASPPTAAAAAATAPPPPAGSAASRDSMGVVRACAAWSGRGGKEPGAVAVAVRAVGRARLEF